MSTSNGGPVTEHGKLISSKNALKHGATSKHFINENEVHEYEQLLSKLQKTYSSDNPLISMQLERIAKIKIQLERINQVINASFEMADIQNNIDEILMNKLQMSEDQESQAREMTEGNMDLDLLIDETRINVSKELNQLSLESLDSPQAFLDQAPQYCQYLYEKAKEHQVPIFTYIAYETSMNKAPDKLKAEIYMKLSKLNNTKEQFNRFQNVNEAILTTSPEDLVSGAKAIASTIYKMKQIDSKLFLFNQLRNMNQSPVSLDFDVLDKLYRYQTTLQRQLSTCIGELLALNKI